MINDFFGVFTESRSEPECNCDSDKILNNLGQEHLNHSDILLLILVNE